MKKLVFILVSLSLVFGCNQKPIEPPEKEENARRLNYLNLSSYPFSRVLDRETEFQVYIWQFKTDNGQENTEGHIKKIRFRVHEYNYLNNTFQSPSQWYETQINTLGTTFSLYNTISYRGKGFDYPARIIVQSYVYRTNTYVWENIGFKDVFARDVNI
ncbi:MAG: hypothetical protein MUC49_14870 [Raineya sp.]|jgi:hypothetical protein|nr:hypothetical protein [Raineya sp.]